LLRRIAFAHVGVRPELVERVRQLAGQGAIIYVMRYRSAIDYLLVNIVLQREGLPLARLAPGVSTRWWRPLGELLRILFRPDAPAESDAQACARLLAAGEPVLLFMRSHS